MKITRKQVPPKYEFTEKQLNDQYVEMLAYRGMRDYRTRLPMFDDCKFYGLCYIVEKKSGKERCAASHSFGSVEAAIEWYKRDFSMTITECYYIKILCMRHDVRTTLIKCDNLFIASVLESEAIER